MVSRVIPVETFDLVIFGGTGDLARRKILPALFRRFCAGQIPQDSRIIGAARGALDANAYQETIKEALIEFIGAAAQADDIDRFLKLLDYTTVNVRGAEGWESLKSKLRPKTVQVFYYSVGPGLFADISTRLNEYGLAGPQTRIVLEKPFGRDLQSAQKLNAELESQFEEGQIYRIDHYLGKETVQNLMALRFGNLLFEPLWNAQYIDHIQITVAETVGVDGRGAYYDKSGAMRDMVQNHIMQLLCLIAMEPPAEFEPNAVRDEKLKVIRALAPLAPHEIVRGQYAGTNGGAGYREDVGDTRSFTESYVALKTHINNWRWSGVPFYLRTGKKLAERTSEIAVVFKKLPHSIFGKDASDHSNILTIQLQPNDGMTLEVTIKEPGLGGMRLIHVPLDMTFAEAVSDGSDAADAYERLIMDVVRGNQTLFMRGDELEAAWQWTDPIIEGWQARSDVPKPYDIGSTGPLDADTFLSRDGRKWRSVKA